MRDCLIVVGMHRSGTSALAGAVHRLGVDFGQDLLEAQGDNVRGYYEHRRILELHEGLLADRGSGWDDLAPRDWDLDDGRQPTAAFRDALSALLTKDFADSSLWAVKDPRLSHLLPTWLPVLDALGARPHALVAVRDPSEVAASLARRDGFSSEKSALLWLQHNLAAERASRSFPRSFVDFAELLKDPGGTLTRAGLQLSLRWPVEPEAAGGDLDTFLDAGLRHQRAAADELSTKWGRLGELVPAMVEALRNAVAHPASSEAFDEIASRLAGSVDVEPLVLEHVHQFGRRELRRELWSAKQSLEEGLRATSERLGGGLQETERRWKSLASRLVSLEEELEQRRRAGQESTAEVDRTLGHLTQALAAAESSLAHLQIEDDNLRARLDRLDDEVDIEKRLISLEAKVARWGEVVDIENKLAVLEAAVARWSGEVDIEGQLATLREKAETVEAALSFLSHRATTVESRTEALAQKSATLSARLIDLKRSWWQRLRSRIRRLVARP